MPPFFAQSLGYRFPELDWFSKVRAAKGDFLVWILCRFAEVF
jgi:hypothetical protein